MNKILHWRGTSLIFIQRNIVKEGTVYAWSLEYFALKLENIAGYPHRMRFKAFNARYRLIAPFKQLRRAEEQAVEDTKLILQNAQQLKSKFGASTSWALGKRHIFLSEGIRQQLENLRSETRRKAATVIQVMEFFAVPLIF